MVPYDEAVRRWISNRTGEQWSTVTLTIDATDDYGMFHTSIEVRGYTADGDPLYESIEANPWTDTLENVVREIVEAAAEPEVQP